MITWVGQSTPLPPSHSNPLKGPSVFVSHRSRPTVRTDGPRFLTFINWLTNINVSILGYKVPSTVPSLLSFCVNPDLESNTLRVPVLVTE